MCGVEKLRHLVVPYCVGLGPGMSNGVLSDLVVASIINLVATKVNRETVPVAAASDVLSRSRQTV